MKLSFGREEDEIADKVVRDLIDEGFDPSQSKSVHAGTLSAFVKEQLAEGVELPEDLLGVYVGRKAIIK